MQFLKNYKKVKHQMATYFSPLNHAGHREIFGFD